MFVCPQDMHWCALSRCASEGCRLTGEPPILSCYSCGALVVRTTSFGLCVDCIAIEVAVKKESA